MTDAPKPWHEIVRKAFEFPAGDWPFALEREIEALEARITDEDLWGEDALRLQKLHREYSRRRECLLKISTGLPLSEDSLVQLKAREQKKRRSSGC